MREYILNIVILILVGGLIRFSTKGKKEKNSVGTYIVQYHKVLKIISLFNMIFTISFLVISIGTLLGVWRIGKNVTIWAPILLGIYFIFPTLIGFMGVNIWKIRVEKEKIIYTNYFGVKKNYNFKELEVNLREDRKIIVTKDGKKAFTIDNNLDASDFLHSAVQYKVLKRN